MRYIKLMIIVLVSFIFITQGVEASTRWVHGEILEVFSEANKVRVLIDGRLDILEVESDVEVFRLGERVSLSSMRPITDQRFQEGLFFFNINGKVEKIIVDYSFVEITTVSETFILYYDIFGELKDIEQIPLVQKDSARF